MHLFCKIFDMRYLFIFIIFFKFNSLLSQVFPSSFWNKPPSNSPIVTTTSISNNEIFRPASGGNVIGDGGGTILTKGVCWSVQPNPTVNNSKTSDGGGLGSYSSQLTGLTPNTKYYLRAYAKNEFGTNYGSEISFTTKAIGDEILGGKVAYILLSGDAGYDPSIIHGLIISNADISSNAIWGCNGINISGAEGNNIGTGNQNTIDITNDCATSGIAARICFDLIQNGYDDWYLPSKGELDIIHSTSVSSLLNGSYWSSTEIPPFGAWGLIFGSSLDGYGFASEKKNPFKVRAVRSF